MTLRSSKVDQLQEGLCHLPALLLPFWEEEWQDTGALRLLEKVNQVKKIKAYFQASCNFLYLVTWPRNSHLLVCQTITSAAQAAKGCHQGVTFHQTGQRLCPTDVSTSSRRLHHAQDFCTLTPKLQCHLIASNTDWVFLPRKRSWRWREGTSDRWSHMFPSFLYTHASFWFTKFLKKPNSEKLEWVSHHTPSPRRPALLLSFCNT